MKSGYFKRRAVLLAPLHDRCDRGSVGKPGRDESPCARCGRARVPPFVCYVLCPGNTNPSTGGGFRFKKTQA